MIVQRQMGVSLNRYTAHYLFMAPAQTAAANGPMKTKSSANIRCTVRLLLSATGGQSVDCRSCASDVRTVLYIYCICMYLCTVHVLYLYVPVAHQRPPLIGGAVDCVFVVLSASFSLCHRICLTSSTVSAVLYILPVVCSRVQSTVDCCLQLHYWN